jgi:PAS domain-containing protein
MMTEAFPAGPPTRRHLDDAAFLRRVIDATSDGIVVHRAIRDESGDRRLRDGLCQRGARGHVPGRHRPTGWVKRLREHLPATSTMAATRSSLDALESGEPQTAEVDAPSSEARRHRLALFAIPRGDEVVVSIRDITVEHEALTRAGRQRTSVPRPGRAPGRVGLPLPPRHHHPLHQRGLRPVLRPFRSRGLVGQRMLDLLPEPPRRRCAVVVAHSRASDVSPTRGILIDLEGNQRWQQWTVSAVIEDGEVTEIQAVGIDITDRKRAEARSRNDPTCWPWSAR